jgi:preprotein translocase subunit SecA
MLDILKKIFGDKSTKDRKEYQPYIDNSNKFFQEFNSLSNDELRGKTAEFKTKIAEYLKTENDKIKELNDKVEKDLTIDVFTKEDIFNEIDKLEKEANVKLEEVLLEILPQAFAVVKETSRRLAEGNLEFTKNEADEKFASITDAVEISGDKATWKNHWTAAGAPVEWKMVHYDVQLMGGAVLHRGNISEMQTGEGKTLVATLPVYLNALAGKGVHLVTVNDYLAKRDSEWMGPLYQMHGMTVDCIDKHQPNSDERRNAYNADITFGTNNEFGFDYLRDNMSSDTESLVQRKHHYAIIDEVDSVLIDDARTPLIISGPTPQGDKHEFHELKPKIETLVAAQRKYVQQCLIVAKKNLALADDENIDKNELKEKLNEGNIALLRAHRGLPKSKSLIKFLSEPGIKVQLQKTENYYMQDNNREMHKIDVELYFVINEKNNTIDLTDKGIDLISSGEGAGYYILPDIGSEIASLEKQSLDKEALLATKDELIRDFSIKSERIHTMNQLLKAYTLFEKEIEYVIMDNKVKIVDEQTGRVMEGRRYSDGLHQAIEAKENVTVEAATQTYATVTLQNYFRMYHKLSGMTGTAETEAGEFWDIYELDVVVIPTNRPILRNDLEDMVYKTQREKYNAVIENVVELVEQNRPVLVGTTTVEISELLSRMLKMRNIPHNVLNAKHHKREAEIVAEAGTPRTVTIATNMAGRGTDIKLSPEVIASGGLAIVGTERHDSRRVDRQLRGRAGRQGDPGSSQFFVSLEDNLMRLFGSERISKMMDRIGLKEGEVIQHSMITKSIERAQKKVEENQFGVRKRLLEYDDVMNAQRKSIYKKRKNALYGDRMEMDTANMFYDVAENVVAAHHSAKDFASFELDLYKYLGIESPVDENDFQGTDAVELADKTYEKAYAHYKAKLERMASEAFPIIEQVHINESGKYKNIAIPVTDGIKAMNTVINLEKAYETKGAILAEAVERNITLGMIDNEWKEHLREMDDLKQSVSNAQYEQKDPLLIYKLESFGLFKKMTARLSNDIVEFLVKAQLPQAEARENKVVTTNESEGAENNYANSSTSRTETPEFQGSEGYDQAMANSQAQSQPQAKQKPVVADDKIGRNDACPCGSGRKYKQCHGK